MPWFPGTDADSLWESPEDDLLEGFADGVDDLAPALTNDPVDQIVTLNVPGGLENIPDSELDPPGRQTGEIIGGELPHPFPDEFGPNPILLGDDIHTFPTKDWLMI